MNCADHHAALSARLDGEPVAEPGGAHGERAALERLEAHLAGCADCRAWLAAAQRLKAMAGTAVGPSQAWTERLLARVSGALEDGSGAGNDQISRHQ